MRSLGIAVFVFQENVFSDIFSHPPVFQSPSRLPPVEQRPNCLVNEVLDGLGRSVIAQIRPNTGTEAPVAVKMTNIKQHNLRQL